MPFLRGIAVELEGLFQGDARLGNQRAALVGFGRGERGEGGFKGLRTFPALKLLVRFGG